MNVLLSAALMGGALMASTSAQAATEFNWSYLGGTVTASGVAIVNDADVLSYISGLVTSGPLAGDTLGPVIPGAGASPSGAFIYDDLGPSDMTVDGWLAHGSASPREEFNIWSNVGASVAYAPITNASFYEWNPASGYAIADNGGVLSFSNVSTVPEPAAWALMIIGFGGIGAVLRKARRKMAVGAAV